jgi:hypothetical protein
MYNPFPLLTTQMLRIKLADGKRYFVRQTFPRGMQAGLRASFLFRAYEAHEKAIAEDHINMISSDSNHFLYDAVIPEHLDKLFIAASQPAGFKIYYAGKKEQDWKPPAEYQLKLKSYIRAKHPGWRPKRGGDKILAGLYEEYGELFLKLSYEDKEEKIPFGEIEKY